MTEPLDDADTDESPGLARAGAVSGLAGALLLLVAAVAFWAISRANFIGADEDGNLAVYQGLPYDLGGGINLYRVRYVSRLLVDQLSPAERKRLFDHHLTGYGAARSEVRRYEEAVAP
jgi:hypothetical protein